MQEKKLTETQRILMDKSNLQKLEELYEKNVREEQAEKDMTTTLRAAVDGISRMDPDGKIMSMDDGYARLLAVDPMDLVGTNWIDTMHPEDWGKVGRAIARCKEGGKSRVLARAILKDNSTVTLAVSFLSKPDGCWCLATEVSQNGIPSGG